MHPSLHKYASPPGTSNRLNLDYCAEASRLGTPLTPIIDVHSHIHGESASKIYRDAAEMYGIECTYTMTQLEDVPTVKRVLGEAVRFIAMPSFSEKDKIFAHGQGYIEQIKKFVSHGAKIVKFWNAPRIYDATDHEFLHNPFRINSPERYEVMRFCEQAGLVFMTHVGDPDTWFAARYQDQKKYGTKLQQYEDLEEALSSFQRPWIGAHMLGYPENLPFLSSLLERYPLLYLDCSATKLVVRELSKHEPRDVRAFFERWKGRVLFGSDIVTSDAHLSSAENKSEMMAKASSKDEAFVLYSSRYWALRTLVETEYDGESPISDPDLHMVEPSKFAPMDAPRLRGMSISSDALIELYSHASRRLLSV